MTADLAIGEQVNVWREDVVEVSLPQADALRGAEKTFEGYIEIPLVLDK